MAQIMPLKEDYFEKDTRSYAKIWIDKNKSLSYEQALHKLRSNQFQLLDSMEIPGKFTRGAYEYWIALVVKNENKNTFPALLYTTRFSEDSTWHFGSKPPVKVKKISKYGETEPYGIIPYPLRWSWIYPIKPFATDTILIKHYNFKPDYNFLPRLSDARLYGARDLSKKIKEKWYYLFGFGALLSVLIIAISIWLYTREIIFFWYAAFCLSLAATALWNFESEMPPLYFISNYIDWTYTKLYVNTLFSAVCHSLFLYYFFKGQSIGLRRVVHGVLLSCAIAAVIETALLATDHLYWSWLFYWWFRVCLMICGLVVLYYVRKIPGTQSKWIITGALSIYVFDIISNFAPDYSSEVTLFGMFIDVFCFTVATASRLKQMQREKYELILAKQTREIEGKAEMERLKNSITQDLRNEIASDLHDDMGTALSSISFLGEMATMQLDKKTGDAKLILERITSQSREMIQTMRGVVWVINPHNDKALDFFDKIRAFAEAVLPSRQIQVSFLIPNPKHDYTLSLAIQRNLFLICKEAIVNIARHSGATETSISIQTTPSSILLNITDNGMGFDTNEKPEGNGLRNMLQRSAQIGATLTMFSKPDEGTSITLLIPIS